MLELVNMPEWIRFIGDRKVKTLDDADRYIQGILHNPTIDYWVISEKETHSPVGIVSFIKRHYLDHYDIGFALLSRFKKKGYAFEATQAILQDARDSGNHSEILATTVKDNVSSIQLLHKLGFSFAKEITNEKETINVFSKKLNT
jgi:RimJ/RimL family protein N-acetyltransferase